VIVDTGRSYTAEVASVGAPTLQTANDEDKLLSGPVRCAADIVDDIPVARRAPPHRVTFSSLLYGAGAVLGAALLAALSLIEPRRQLAKLTTSRAAPVVGVLRRAHSGHVGDYVAWLTAGSATLGILLTLALT
jgi:multicomponent Na+:H+ antiporter subunit D